MTSGVTSGGGGAAWRPGGRRGRGRSGDRKESKESEERGGTRAAPGWGRGRRRERQGCGQLGGAPPPGRSSLCVAGGDRGGGGEGLAEGGADGVGGAAEAPESPPAPAPAATPRGLAVALHQQRHLLQLVAPAPAPAPACLCAPPRPAAAGAGLPLLRTPFTALTPPPPAVVVIVRTCLVPAGGAVEPRAVALEHEQGVAAHIDQVPDGVERVGLLAVADVADLLVGKQR